MLGGFVSRGAPPRTGGDMAWQRLAAMATSPPSPRRKMSTIHAQEGSLA